MNNWEYIHGDNRFVQELDLKTKIRLIITNDHWVVISRYLRYLRRQEIYQKKRGLVSKLLALYWGRRKNSLGNKLGFHIPAFTLGPGANIYHHGAITINGDARIGNNCSLHGMNCIGNNGIDNKAPIIGNNVDIGVGASIIGGIEIADEVKIGAGAVVIYSCQEKGDVLVGMPAKSTQKERS
ncbi:MAG: serine acetyltransferase [Lachnospiraceae bacterium]